MASSHSPSSLRKHLRTDPNPPPAAPLNSASSSSTTTIPPPEKRTRDQPNLSDCHCCARRINHTNPKDRLQPLDSIWRIVLLCRKCRKNVNSGQSCPYCFKETENSGNLFRCCVCLRRIHKDCAGEYRNCAPFCYMGVDLGFRVCVDCWVPDSLKKSIRTCGGSENTGASNHKIEAKDSSEKLKMGVNEKYQALKKATVTKNVASDTERILDFVRKKGRNEQKDVSSDCSEKTKVIDDAELAFRLHRAMNSSPRILMDSCQVNSCLDDLKNGNLNAFSCKGLVLGGDQSADSAEFERNDWTDKRSLYSGANELALGPLMYKREKKRKTWQEIRSTLPEQMKLRLQLKDPGSGIPIKWNGDIWEILFCVSSDQGGSCMNINRFGQDPVVYKRARFRQKACKGSGFVECSSFDNCRDIFESQNLRSDEITHELPLVESGTVCVAKCNTEVSSPNGKCNDRYFLKYARTDRGFKCGDKVILPDRSCNEERDSYFVKYRRIKNTKSVSTGPVSDIFLSSKHACTPSSLDLQAGCSEKSGIGLNLPHGGHDEEPDLYFFKYAKKMKGSHSGLVDEATLHSDTN